MPKAVWNGEVIADSPTTLTVDGYPYFPLASLRRDFFRDSEHTSICGWKGTASYFDVVVGGEVNRNAAWIYRTPKPAAQHVTDHVGFWKGIRVEP